MKTSLVLSAHRIVSVWTGDLQPMQSRLSFEHHGMTVRVPLRTAELKKIRDAITEHIKNATA